jgi:hypothetical protein
MPPPLEFPKATETARSRNQLAFLIGRTETAQHVRHRLNSADKRMNASFFGLGYMSE